MSDLSTEGIRSLVEKYCPVVGHNVAVEVTRCGHTELSSSCLRSHDCKLERGGCTNSIFGAKESASASPANRPPVL